MEHIRKKGWSSEKNCKWSGNDIELFWKKRYNQICYEKAYTTTREELTGRNGRE